MQKSRQEKKESLLTKPGLTRETVLEISELKHEPEWMTERRLHAYSVFKQKKLPTWGGKLTDINFDDIIYYFKPKTGVSSSWEDVPGEIRETYEKIGIPQAEQKYLAGVMAQYESEAVYHSLRDHLAQQGVIFLDMDTGLKEHPDLIKQYFGTIIPIDNNKFASLNSAVWSGGSFVYVPKGVKVEIDCIAEV